VQDAQPAQTAAPARKPQPAQEEAATEDAAETPAEAFYAEASDDPDAELTDDLFAALDFDFSVQAELDAILESIEGTKPTEGQADTDA
jgi:hypothetical protein